MPLFKPEKVLGSQVGAGDNRVFIACGASGAANTTAALTAGRFVYAPLIIPRPMLVSKIGFNVTTLLAGNARVGLMHDNRGGPGKIIADSGDVSTGTTGQKVTNIGPFLLQPGYYWTGIVGSAAATLTAISAAGATIFTGYDSALAKNAAWIRNGAYGAFVEETLSGLTANTSNYPLVYVGIA